MKSARTSAGQPRCDCERPVAKLLIDLLAECVNATDDGGVPTSSVHDE